MNLTGNHSLATMIVTITHYESIDTSHLTIYLPRVKHGEIALKIISHLTIYLLRVKNRQIIFNSEHLL
jgi:hypothetical protein